MNPTDLSPAELREELDRIDRMRGPLTGATMMRRNAVRQELERRPVQPSVYLGNGFYVDADSPAGRDVLRNQRPLNIEEPARKMRAQLAALRGVGQ